MKEWLKDLNHDIWINRNDVTRVKLMERKPHWYVKITTRDGDDYVIRRSGTHEEATNYAARIISE